jgi:DNA-directed RNA polymerase subunit RPC12/RpoP
MMENRLRDRMDCLNCGKEILNPDRKRIYNCPHCGDSIMFVKWMEPDDVQELAAMAFTTDTKATAAKDTKRGGFKRFFGK